MIFIYNESTQSCQHLPLASETGFDPMAVSLPAAACIVGRDELTLEASLLESSFRLTVPLHKNLYY